MIDTNLIGTGIYTVPEASRLTGVSSARIRRWLRGYSFIASDGQRTSPPVWTPELPSLDGKLALSFQDLVEVRFVDAFLDQGVSWKVVRLAAEKAREVLDSTHPFSTRKFRTDGRTIFAEIRTANGETALVELTKSQHYFQRVIAPYLRDLEFEDNHPARWWPLGMRRRQVVIDPARSFGQPIVAKRGIPTAVLAQAVRANNSVSEVASWFELDIRAVKAAVHFEQWLQEKKIAA